MPSKLSQQHDLGYIGYLITIKNSTVDTMCCAMQTFCTQPLAFLGLASIRADGVLVISIHCISGNDTKMLTQALQIIQAYHKNIPQSIHFPGNPLFVYK